MNTWDSQRFLRDGASETSKEVLHNAVSIATVIRAHNPDIAPLFTLNHLAQASGVSYAFLRSVIERRDQNTDLSKRLKFSDRDAQENYRVFKLKKRNVGHLPDRFRFVCAPHPQLLKVQRWIHHEILSKVPVSDASFAYRSDGGILKAAKLHTQAKWLIKLDITNFFESILEPDVYKLFRGLGYQPLLSFELARLCTRLRARGNPYAKGRRAQGIMPYKEIAPDGLDGSLLGHVPQGAATSPLLANLAARELDDLLLTYCQTKDLVYSRYADDLTFSTQSDFNREKAVNVVHDIYQILRKCGFWPNRAKTVIVPPGARKIVLGLLVDSDKPRLTRDFKEKIRTHVYYLRRKDVGPLQHAKFHKFDSVYGMQRHIYGLVAFAYGIEKDWARKVFEELSHVSWPKFEGF